MSAENQEAAKWTVACESGEWFVVQADYIPVPPTLENAKLMASAPDLERENELLKSANQDAKRLGDAIWNLERENVKLRQQRDELLEALEKVMSWISNWSPDFTMDDEWDVDEAKAKAAIANIKQQCDSVHLYPTSPKPVALFLSADTFRSQHNILACLCQ